MVTVVVGRPDGEHVELEVVRRERPQASDFWDGNWLSCQVSLRVGSFSARYLAALRAEEFERWLKAAQALSRTLQGEATFHTLEGQLLLSISSVGSLGGLRVTGEARDQAGTGNRLRFALGDFDQTELPGLLGALEDVVRTYPVVGRPEGS